MGLSLLTFLAVLDWSHVVSWISDTSGLSLSVRKIE
jgi:hypothetical protein